MTDERGSFHPGDPWHPDYRPKPEPAQWPLDLEEEAESEPEAETPFQLSPLQPIETVAESVLIAEPSWAAGQGTDVPEVEPELREEEREEDAVSAFPTEAAWVPPGPSSDMAITRAAGADELESSEILEVGVADASLVGEDEDYEVVEAAPKESVSSPEAESTTQNDETFPVVGAGYLPKAGPVPPLQRTEADDLRLNSVDEWMTDEHPEIVDVEQDAPLPLPSSSEAVVIDVSPEEEFAVGWPKWDPQAGQDTLSPQEQALTADWPKWQAEAPLSEADTPVAEEVTAVGLPSWKPETQPRESAEEEAELTPGADWHPGARFEAVEETGQLEEETGLAASWQAGEQFLETAASQVHDESATSPGFDLGPPPGWLATSTEWKPDPEIIGSREYALAEQLAADLQPASFSLDQFDDHHFLQGATQEHLGLAEAMATAGTEEGEPSPAMAAPMPGIAGGVVGFDDVDNQEESADPEASGGPLPGELGSRVVSGIVLISAFLLALALGRVWLWGLVGLIALMALGEFYAVLRHLGYRPVAIFGMLGGAGALIGSATDLGVVAVAGSVALATVGIFAFYAAEVHPPHRPWGNAALTVLGMAWVAGGLSFAMPIIRADNRVKLLLAIVGLTIAMDVGAYFVGRRWGRRPLAPTLSPKKTVEGLLGGIGLTALTATGLGLWLDPPFSMGGALALGAGVGVFAVAGDLAESMLKRQLEIKDMGWLLPGHGGLLDRIDSLLFVVPAAYTVLRWTGIL